MNHRALKIIEKAFVFLFVFLMFACNGSVAQDKLKYERFTYKEIGDAKLDMLVFYPHTFKSEKDHSAIVFFFGGGWINGGKNQFINHAKYFAQRGLVSFLVDYRTESKHNTSPFEALKDAKTAIRYIRENASRFGINSDKIIASGGSAGGHLAAATALTTKFNEGTDDLSISCVPNALVLFNPVIDNGPGGYGHKRIGDQYKDFSPMHNINQGVPPTIFFIGTKDHHVSIATAERYKSEMEKVNSRCDLKIYEGEKHGFWNYRNFENYKKTISEADMFLQSLGYLEEKPIVKITPPE